MLYSLNHCVITVQVIPNTSPEAKEKKMKNKIRHIISKNSEIWLRGFLGCLCLLTIGLLPAQAFGQTEVDWGGERLTFRGDAEYDSAKFGRVILIGETWPTNRGYVEGLHSILDATGNGLWHSPEYGTVERGDENPGWVVSSVFGWTHFAPDADTYAGWVWTERFQWMSFVWVESAAYLWAHNFRSWMVVNADQTFYNFDWGHLTPQGMDRYVSSIFGGLTTGDFGGWVASDVFGWMWSNGDGTWFWSEDRQEWLGVTADGGIWSTAEERFIGLTDDPGPGPGSGEDGMARIPAGWFTMGRTSGDTDSNAPPVNVYVSEFYMAKHPVTWALWNEVRNWAVQNGYTDIGTGGGKAANHPVHSVNWWDAVKWLNARSEWEGLDPVYRNADGTVFKTGTTAPTANWNANGYRLPTEAEWEKAARGGVSGQRFPWGDTITHSQANYWSSSSRSYDISPTRGYHPTYNDGTTPYTSPVGSFAANGYGLYDMSGNVCEWCWDWYSASTYTDGASDPKGASSGTFRVSRGGSWSDVAIYGRSAYRIRINPSHRYHYDGFRPARSSVP
jgi:formylglycine-generating enzyme required for sulfatase activity